MVMPNGPYGLGMQLRRKRELDENDEEKGIRRAFINPIILDEYGDDYGFEEGCLSIPDVRAEIIFVCYGLLVFCSV